MKKAANTDELYRLNEGQNNNLTGPSGNAVGAFLAVAISNSMPWRSNLCCRYFKYLGCPVTEEFGQRILTSTTSSTRYPRRGPQMLTDRDRQV